MIQQNISRSDRPYKEAFVDFIKSREWHWFITIPIGLCDSDDVVLKRLRAIEAAFCGKYLVNRYHKLPDEARFSMVAINDDQPFPVGVSVFVEQNSFIVGLRFREGLGTVSFGRYNIWSREYGSQNLYGKGCSPSRGLVVTV